MRMTLRDEESSLLAMSRKRVSGASAKVRQMEAFEAFYRSSFSSVLRASIAFCGDQDLAREATQEAFSRCLARWRRLHDKEWLEGWVMKASFNQCRGHWRYLRRERGIAERVMQPSGAYELGGADPELAAAIGALPSRQREAILLYYLADNSISGVATVMDLSEGAVKSHLFRAREGLKQRLAAKPASIEDTGGEE